MWKLVIECWAVIIIIIIIIIIIYLIREVKQDLKTCREVIFAFSQFLSVNLQLPLSLGVYKETLVFSLTARIFRTRLISCLREIHISSLSYL